jgi:hypothetical protein
MCTCFKMENDYLTKERLEKMVRLNYECTCMMEFMQRDKGLWDNARSNDEYVVGVMEDSNSDPMTASRHYFTNQKNAMHFIAQCDFKGVHIEKRHHLLTFG